MLRGWKGIAVLVAVALAFFAGAVLYSIHRQAKPRGFSGLEFARLTPSASARTPLLDRGGVLIQDVAADSPAAKAGIKPGEVLAAIDGAPITSARHASDIVRSRAAGDHITLTLYDITQGEVRPRNLALTFDAAPLETKKFSVHPPRTLAREAFSPPTAAANASWSPRILRGPTIRPLALSGLGAGHCNGFAPEGWKVAGHASDNSMFHLMAGEGFAHAIYQSAQLQGASAPDFIAAYLEKTFGSPVVLTPPEPRTFDFVLQNFGNRKGAAGFVLYRVAAGRVVMWIVAVPGGDAGWAKPLVGAVALSVRCASPGAPAAASREAAQLATRISLRCIRGACDEGDFAGAAYLPVLRFGYVHNEKGDMFLLRPRRDFWQNGAEGPGFYHQIGGENERLYPGRIN
jgi:hypothetical protein